MSASPKAAEVAAREAEFDRVAGTEASGSLSPAEKRVGHEVDFEAQAWQRRCAARAVLRQELIGSAISFAALRRDPTRGEVAAKLYDTWSDETRSEAIVETSYSVTSIYADLRAAMNAQGLSTFEERCAVVGKRMVEAAVEYVLDCHGQDAEAVEDALRTEQGEADAPRGDPDGDAYEERLIAERGRGVR